MSEPKTHYSDKLQGAISELVSAMSALNMHPDHIPRSETVDGILEERRYLSQSDRWAKHCYEHLHAVFALLNDAHTDMEVLKGTIYRLRLELAEATRGRHQ